MTLRTTTHRMMMLAAVVGAAGFAAQARAAIMLNSAGNFAVLAGSTVTNTGPTLINGGDVGVSPGAAITGFLAIDAGPGIIAAPYTTHVGSDGVAVAAQHDLTTAYNAAKLLPLTATLTGQDLGGKTLQPGVYFFSSSAALTGTLTLDDMGDPNAQFVFQIGSTLTAAANSAVVTINGGTSPGASVFWQVGSSATLGTGSAFEGHILALASISMDTGATLLDGSALAQTGAVTLAGNAINNAVSSGGATVPEPGMVMLGATPLVLMRRRRSLK